MLINTKTIKRNFILGDEWLYFKIYTGINISDTILTKIIKPVTQKLLNEEVIDSWFFIRYIDPDYHLRVRVHYNDPQQLLKIIKEFNLYFTPFLNQGLILKIQTDTYQREIERYGVKSMHLSENLFYHESKMVVDFFDLIEGNEGEELRWLFALKTIDSFFNVFGFNLNEKLNKLNDLNDDFSAIFGLETNKKLRKQINDKYRREATKIEMIFNSEDFKNNNKEMFSLIAKNEKQTKNIAAEILALNANKELKVNFEYLINSFMHMLLNRIFKSKNKQHEMMCYNFLFRYYKSTYMQNKKNHE